MAIFENSEIKIQLLKKFDGKNNYFNCSSLNSKTIFRKEYNVDKKILLSDVVDDDDNTLLKHYNDEDYYYSFEDARWIDEDNISVSVAKYDKNDVTRLEKVLYKKYNIKTKKFYHFITQRAYFEKNWQFYDNNIIYHINPYIIFDENEDELFKKNINWDPWINMYGYPGLSTNVFDVDDEKYILYHSYINKGPRILKYYVGILKLNDDFKPIGYCLSPLLESNRNLSDENLLNDLWNWRITDHLYAAKYEIIFPMNIQVGSVYLDIYGGINDCSAALIQIDKDKFIDRIKNQPFVVY